MERPKPSSREKKRYIVFQVSSGEELRYEEIRDSIMDACLKYMGIFGAEKAGIQVLRNLYIPSKKRGVFRVNNKVLDGMKKAISKVDKIAGKEACIKITGISGILKKAKYKFLEV